MSVEEEYLKVCFKLLIHTYFYMTEGSIVLVLLNAGVVLVDIAAGIWAVEDVIGNARFRFSPDARVKLDDIADPALEQAVRQGILDVLDEAAENSGKVTISVDDFLQANVPSEHRLNVRNAFANDIKVTMLTEDLTVYRYYGNGSNPKSFWVTPNQYSDPASSLALPSVNSTEHMAAYTIPKGTIVLEGTVAPNFGNIGGGYQIYVPDPSVLY